MNKLLRSITLICAFVATTVLPSRGQVTTLPAADSNATTGQAPDEVMKKLSDLVHAGKYEEAQQLTSGLLVAYPTDQRLLKAKTLLDKAVASPKPSDPVASGNPPTGNVASPQPASNLTGMDKVDYNGLIELAKEAQQNTDLEQQRELLKQFMDQSVSFLQKHPDQMLLWQLRAAAAISLDDITAGYEAGQRLLAMGAADSNNSNLQHLLAQLKNKGWLDKQKVQEQVDSAQADRLKVEHDKYTFPAEHHAGPKTSYGHLTINENGAVYESSDGNTRFSIPKTDIREIRYVGPTLLVFISRDGKHFGFRAVTEEAVAKKDENKYGTLSPSVLGNAVVERWRFLSTDGSKTLKAAAP